MTDQIIVYSTVWCPDCKRAKKFFNDHRIQYTNIDIEKDAEAMEYVEQVNQGMRIIPTIVFPDGSTLSEPSNAELARKLGIKTRAKQSSYDVIVIGAGPSGLTAALYMTREGMDVLVIEKASVGGQIGVTQILENYPGFDEGISGAELADRLGQQAQKFGAEILEAQEVKSISQQGIFWVVETADGSSYNSKAVLMSTGARYRRLNIPGEEELMGINVHFCATCDGAFYKGKKVLVIGGGNSGFEEGLFLTKFATKVEVIHRRDELRAGATLQKRAQANEKMSFIWNTVVEEILGEDGKVNAVRLRNVETGDVYDHETDGVFIFVGHDPNGDLFEGQLERDQYGYVVTDREMHTSVEGVFAAGEIQDRIFRQVATSVGQGTSAAMTTERWLAEQEVE